LKAYIQVLLIICTWHLLLNGKTAEVDGVGLFKEILSDVGLDQNESKGLLSNVARNPIQVLAVHATREDYLVLYVRRMPEVLKESEKSEIVSKKAANEILSLAATRSSEVLNKLESFTYPEVLIDYARKRLFSKVKGRIVGLGERKCFFEKGNEFGMFVRLPRQFVDLSAIELISKSSTQSYYAIAVNRLAQKSLTEEKFEDSMKMLLESLKYGNNNKGLFINLYKCFLGTSNKDESSRLSLYLEKRFGDEIGFDQSLNLAVLSENAEFSEQSNFWYTKAESFVGLSPSPEVFLQED